MGIGKKNVTKRHIFTSNEALKEIGSVLASFAYRPKNVTKRHVFTVHEARRRRLMFSRVGSTKNRCISIKYES